MVIKRTLRHDKDTFRAAQFLLEDLEELLET